MKLNDHRYYSQQGEDYILWQLFKGKARGFFVDVGAFDGIHLSNTFSFEQAGWSGICIEPNPEFFELCKQNRKGSVCLQVACVADKDLKTVTFYKEELGLLSGTCGDRKEDVRSRYEKRGLNFAGFEKIIVPAVTLDRVLEEYLPPGREIDFISIDVEGTELQVLKGFNLSRFNPRVLIVEANSEEMRVQIEDYLQVLEYIPARRLGPNIFFVRSLEDLHSISLASSECQIEPVLHPLGEAYTLRSILKARGEKVSRWRTFPKTLYRKARSFLGKFSDLIGG
jgi:FkbM family methyltransferase